MATLMSWGNSDGELGRCDAKCHEAEGPDCDCMCGGRYHGAGRDGTLEDRMKTHGEEILEAARARAAAAGVDLKAESLAGILEALSQGNLFQ